MINILFYRIVENLEISPDFGDKLENLITCFDKCINARDRLSSKQLIECCHVDMEFIRNNLDKSELLQSLKSRNISFIDKIIENEL